MLGVAGSEAVLSANDATFNHSIEDIIREKRLANGALVRYKVTQINHWQWRYSWLPGKQRDVYDGGLGRDELLALYKADQVMNFIVPNQSAAPTTYSVRFEANSYRDRIVWRGGPDATAWEVMFNLVQVI
jgi:hypothetical protein